MATIENTALPILATCVELAKGSGSPRRLAVTPPRGALHPCEAKQSTFPPATEGLLRTLPLGLQKPGLC